MQESNFNFQGGFPGQMPGGMPNMGGMDFQQMFKDPEFMKKFADMQKGGFPGMGKQQQGGASTGKYLLLIFYIKKDGIVFLFS